MKIRRGEALHLVSAVLLVAVMFATWYGADVAGQARAIELGGGTGAGGNAWQSLGLIPYFLLLTAICSIATVLVPLFGGRRPALSANAVVAVLGGIATLLVLFRILFPPDFGDLGGVALEATLKLGAFGGLAAALGIAVGGYRAMREEGSSFEAVAESLQPRRPRPASRKRRSSSSG
jgi:hypothetical protein